MCGRFTLRADQAELEEVFALLRAQELPPRYNVAPTQTVAVVRPAGGSGRREMALVRWGLVPSWADDAKVGPSMINARSETAATRPAFRDALRDRRCLVPADGFFEWQKVPGQKKKQPFLIELRDGGLFSFAGLWERWIGPDGNPLETCTILTTDANDLVAPIHDRMPVILDRGDYDRWLDPATRESQKLAPLLAPFPSGGLRIRPVSSVVNSWQVDSPECVAPP